MQSRSQEINFWFTFIPLVIEFGMVCFFYNIDIVIASLMFGCFLIGSFLKVQFELVSVLTLYFLIPSDAVSYLFVISPLGKFPLYIILIFIFIIINLFNRKVNTRYFEKNEFNIFVGLFMIIICQTMCLLVFSANEILSNMVKFIAQTVGILILVKTMNIRENDIIRVCFFILFLSTVTIIEGGFELFGGFNLYSIYGNTDISNWLEWMANSRTSLWRVKSTFANPLIYSSAMVLSLTCVEYIKDRIKNTIIPLVLITILAVGMLMGGSRSSIVILAIYLIYYVINSSVKQKIFFILGILIVSVLLLHFMDLSLVVERFSQSNSDGSVRHRLSAYSVFVSVFSRYFLIGCGLGNTYNVLDNEISGSFTVNTFDNAFMDFGLAVGIIGLTALCIVFKGVVGICKKKDHKLVMFAALLLFALSFFLNTTKYQSLWGIFWIYAALNIYAEPEYNRKDGIVL